MTEEVVILSRGMTEEVVILSEAKDLLIPGRDPSPPLRSSGPLSLLRMTGEKTYATFSQRQSSGIVGRLPYDRMPVRKIFAVTQNIP
jgi:hypothetical protein